MFTRRVKPRTTVRTAQLHNSNIKFHSEELIMMVDDVIPILRILMKKNQEFKTSLRYVVSLRTA